MNTLAHDVHRMVAAWRTARAGAGPDDTFWHGVGVLPGGLDWHTLTRALDDATLEPGMVRVIGPAGRVHEDDLVDTTHRAGIANRELRAPRLRRLLQDGCTVTVNGIDRISAPVRTVREVLEYAVSTRAWCNGFASASADSAFGEHRDPHHTVVVQGSGTKHWRVRDPSTDEVVHDSVVAPGDVLHVPYGWPHEVTGTGGPSLHWTFGWRAESDQQLLLDDLRRRADKGALDPGELTATLTGDSTVAAADARARRQATSPMRRVGTSLPWSLAPETIDPEDVEVTWAARLPPLVSQTAETLLVETLGKRLTLDPRLAPPLRRLAPGAPVHAVDLVGPDLDRAAVAAFLAWGVEQDVLILRPTHRPTGA